MAKSYRRSANYAPLCSLMSHLTYYCRRLGSQPHGSMLVLLGVVAQVVTSVRTVTIQCSKQNVSSVIHCSHLLHVH